MRLRRPLAAAALAAALVAGTIPANASHLPESDAKALEILSDYYPGYWWDHTDITVAAQAAPERPASAPRCRARRHRHLGLGAARRVR